MRLQSSTKQYSCLTSIGLESKMIIINAAGSYSAQCTNPWGCSWWWLYPYGPANVGLHIPLPISVYHDRKPFVYQFSKTRYFQKYTKEM